MAAIHPSPMMPSRSGSVQNDVRLPEGDFTTRLARLRVNLAFTPDISWQTIAQYDNVSDRFGIQSRFKWIVEPGDEIFLVLNQGFEAVERTPANEKNVGGVDLEKILLRVLASALGGHSRGASLDDLQ